ncbi:MATE family efflux transporter [Anaeromicropila herbilytica]|uniref:Probable multidrug resistance protein NorM n=1 Tax=Anaeromicropila herbilytica TaxID=2785025 RepID=A0A7R7EIC3_9FIRM|nr:MATE family efflux transporter [Anaeromicropila herbilytica]BCN29234.1 MATE family multidrug exporter [Anaeromicropila herbilytica]
METNLEKKRFFTNRDLFSLFLPLTIEQGLEYTVGMAASMMVAQVGESAVSGVSLVDFVMALIISIFAALATGGSVIAGQYLGRKEDDRARKAANQLVKASFVLSLMITVLLYLCKPLILHNLFGEVTKEVEHAANQYFMVVAISVPFLALYNAGAAIFRTMGNAKLPMKIMIIMNILNVAGNALLVTGFHMGVIGVAIPTLVSRAGAALIILVIAHKKDLELRITNFVTTPFDFSMLKRILNIGAPFGFENGMFYLGRLVVLSIVSIFGTASIAANSVSGTIVMFEVLPGMAMNLGLSVIISRCVGAGDYEQAKYYKKKVRRIMHISFIISSAIVLAFMPLILKVYNLSAEANSMTWTIVIAHAVMMILIWPSGYMLPIVFRGAGDAKFPMIVSIVSMILCRIALSYVFALGFHMGMLGTWVAMFVDWIVKSIIYEWHYKKDSWTRFQVI